MYESAIKRERERERERESESQTPLDLFTEGSGTVSGMTLACVTERLCMCSAAHMGRFVPVVPRPSLI